MKINFKNTLLATLLSLLSWPSLAQWTLESEHSTINFTTVKKEHILENHQFDKFEAAVSAQGQLNLSIDLNSVNTNIAIRDQRMKTHLFNTPVYPQATFKAHISHEMLKHISVGKSKGISVEGLVDLHGHTQQVTVNVLVTKISEKRLLVVSQTPLVIYAQNFGLIAGINKLKSLAQLPSITHSVALNFVLNFTAQ